MFVMISTERKTPCQDEIPSEAEGQTFEREKKMTTDCFPWPGMAQSSPLVLRENGMFLVSFCGQSQSEVSKEVGYQGLFSQSL